MGLYQLAHYGAAGAARLAGENRSLHIQARVKRAVIDSQLHAAALLLSKRWRDPSAGKCAQFEAPSRSTGCGRNADLACRAPTPTGRPYSAAMKNGGERSATHLSGPATIGEAKRIAAARREQIVAGAETIMRELGQGDEFRVRLAGSPTEYLKRWVSWAAREVAGKRPVANVPCNGCRRAVSRRCRFPSIPTSSPPNCSVTSIWCAMTTVCGFGKIPDGTEFTSGGGLHCLLP